MIDVNRRLVNVLAGLVSLAIFLAGLFIPGRVGGAILLVTVAMLVVASYSVWDQIRPQGRPLRVAVIAVVAVVAVIKLVHG
jgi:hypothetical protein